MFVVNLLTDVRTDINSSSVVNPFKCTSQVVIVGLTCSCYEEADLSVKFNDFN